MERKHSILELLTVIAFIAVIFGFSIADILCPDKKFSENENRILAQMPELSMENVKSGEFMLDYDKYVSDQFIGRDMFVGIKTVTELLLGKKDINGVFISKDNYYIETMDTTDVDEERLAKNINYIAKFVQKYADILGKDKISVMLVPTASEILSDKLPSFAGVYSQKNVIDRVIELISAGGNESVFIDLTEVLKSHSKEYIYYRTDHHWTTYGALLGYNYFAQTKGFETVTEEDFDITVLTDEFLGTIYSKLNIPVSKKDTISMYEYKDNAAVSVEYNMDKVKHDTMYEMSYLDGKDKYAVFLNSNNALVQIDVQRDTNNEENEAGENNKKSIAVIKDSYANCFIPFLTKDYDTIYVIDLRYFNMPVSSFIASYDVTDILVLYNIRSFVDDMYLSKIVR